MATDDITKTIICGENNNQPQIAAGVKDISYNAHNFALAVTKKVFSSLPHHCNEFACLRFLNFYSPISVILDDRTTQRTHSQLLGRQSPTLPRIASAVCGTGQTNGG